MKFWASRHEQFKSGKVSVWTAEPTLRQGKRLETNWSPPPKYVAGKGGRRVVTLSVDDFEALYNLEAPVPGDCFCFKVSVRQR